MYNIEVYVDKNGDSEIIDYLKSLRKNKGKESKIKVEKIDAYVRLLRENGLPLNEKYVKKIDCELWELRPLRDRILFASLNNNKFILLSIFIKKTQKTPKREIEKAKRLLRDYKERSVENEKISNMGRS